MSLGMETKQTKSSRVVIINLNARSRIPVLPEPVDSQTKTGGRFKRTRHVMVVAFWVCCCPFNQLITVKRLSHPTCATVWQPQTNSRGWADKAALDRSGLNSWKQAACCAALSHQRYCMWEKCLWEHSHCFSSSFTEVTEGAGVNNIFQQQSEAGKPVELWKWRSNKC